MGIKGVPLPLLTVRDLATTKSEALYNNIYNLFNKIYNRIILSGEGNAGEP